MDNTEEMDSYLEKYNLLRLNQKEIEKINRPSISNEIVTMIKILPPNQSPGPDGFTGGFYQGFREVASILLKFFCKTAEGGTLSK